MHHAYCTQCIPPYIYQYLVGLSQYDVIIKERSILDDVPVGNISGLSKSKGKDFLVCVFVCFLAVVVVVCVVIIVFVYYLY